MWTLYDNAESANGYKARLTMHQLGIAYRRVELDIFHGATRTPEYLAKNPNGKIPLLELDDGTCLPESNAICCYVAEGSALMPSERLARAQVLSWLFFEQYSHEPFVATSRFILRHTPPDHPRRQELAWRIPKAHEALSVMETHLSARRYFACERYTVADVALYAYTHLAHEATLDLTPYPSVRAWLARVEAEPRHLPMSA